MTRDEILALANEAGITFVNEFGVASATVEWLERFAGLVAAAEREAIIAMAYEMEMETTEYCMNVYEEGEKYKCDLIDAISARNQQ